MSTAIIIPVLRRPHRVAPLLANIAVATPEPHHVLFIATTDDEEEIAALEEAGAAYTVVDYQPVGDYARKINLGYRTTDDPFIFTGADDLNFHPGWLAAALARMAVARVGVVGTQDLGSPRVKSQTHSTHSLVRRAYVERFGLIDRTDLVLCEEYVHEYVDDELVGTAVRRRAFAFAHDSIVEHMHPSWGKSATDELYDAQGTRMNAGRAIFMRRRRLWM